MTADPPDPAIPSVRLDGVTYRLVFAALFRRHTPAERVRLATSIRRHGVRVRVLTYDSSTWGRRCVIDGASRLELAAGADESVNLTVPVQHLGDLTDEAARELALTLNADRRHLTPEEQHAARRERIERVAAARAAGDSLRTIAEREGVSLGQVQRDLSDGESGVSGDTPVAGSGSGVSPDTPTGGVSGDTPARVRGADGKSYPATRPHRPDDAGVSGDTPAPHEPLRPQERHLAQARTALARLRAALEELLAGEWGEYLRRTLERHRADRTAADLDAALSDLAADAAQGFGG
jgi:hypothetical protein